MAEPERGGGRRRELIFAGSAILAAGVLVAVLVLFLGARLDAATIGLAATCAALLYALRGLFFVVDALARPHVELVLAGESASGRAKAELRDEKRRVLRAIKELDFDFGMRKLSQADYDAIRGAYQVRAVEVMRDLDDAGTLHPEVAKLLDRKAAGQPIEPAPAPASEADAGDATPAVAQGRTCGGCGGSNDVDAKFCKHCGQGLEESA
jgi:hypothetical protein